MRQRSEGHTCWLAGHSASGEKSVHESEKYSRGLCSETHHSGSSFHSSSGSLPRPTAQCTASAPPTPHWVHLEPLVTGPSEGSAEEVEGTRTHRTEYNLGHSPQGPALGDHIPSLAQNGHMHGKCSLKLNSPKDPFKKKNCVRHYPWNNKIHQTVTTTTVLFGIAVNLPGSRLALSLKGPVSTL